MDHDFKNHIYNIASQQQVHQTTEQSDIQSGEAARLKGEIQELLNILPQRSDLLVEKLISEPIHLQHAEQVLDTAKRTGYVSQDLLTLKAKIFRFVMDGERNSNKAKVILDDIEQIVKNTKLQLKPLDYALFLNSKGYFIAIDKSDYQAAMKCSFEALKILETFEGVHEEKLSVITNIAQDFIIRGMNNEGEKWLHKGDNSFRNSKSMVNNIFFLYGYIILHENKGEYDLALQFMRRATQNISALNLYPIMQFGVRDQEIQLLLKIKNFDQAKICNDKLQVQITKFYKDRESSYLARNILYNAWIVCETEHDYDRAIIDINQSIAIADRIFHGPDMHILQPLQHTILGRAYEGQQKYEQALVEYQFAERIYKKILEQLNGMDDVSQLYQHLVLISLKLNQPEQAQQYFETHLKLFGSDHPRSKELQKTLGHAH